MATKSSLEAQLHEVKHKVIELTTKNAAFTQERAVLKKGIVELQDQLLIARTEVILLVVLGLPF